MSLRAYLLLLGLLSVTALGHGQFQPSETIAQPLSGPPGGERTSGGAIIGEIANLAGRPLPGVRIVLRDSARGHDLANTVSGVNGNFKILGVAPGTYTLVASQGIHESSQQVQLSCCTINVHVSMNAAGAASSDQATVSVGQLQVPEKAGQEFEKGQEELRKNKPEKALQRAERALNIYPHYAQALVLRGVLRMQQGNIKAAQTDFQQAIADDPGYAMSYIAMGASLNEQKKYEDAARSLERGKSLDPQAWQAWYELSKSALAQSDYESALRFSTRAEELQKDYAPIHLMKAHSLLALKEYGQAVDEYKVYLAMEPAGPNAEQARRAMDHASSFMQRAQR